MSLYVRLQSSFWNHRKTLRLRAILGETAFWLPQRLWSYAAENQPDGDFSDYLPAELGMLLGFGGDAQAMLKAMQQAGFMDGMKIHDWAQHNSYHSTFSERAKIAAAARWKGKERIGKERRQALLGACLEHKNGAKEWNPSELQRRVGKLFNKRESTPWSSTELKTWAGTRQIVEETTEGDWLVLQWAYRQKSGEVAKYRNQKLQQLLNSWSDMIYRAKTLKQESEKL